MALRDLALTLLLLAALPVSLRRPYIGVLFFIWISLMNPHRLTWGFASSFSWAMMIGVATIIGFVASPEKKLADSLVRYRWGLVYFAWMGITTLFAFEFAVSYPKLVEFAKSQLMCVIALSLLLTWRRIELFVIVALLSVVFYGVKGGFFTIVTGGNFLVWGPYGSVIRDNNQLATALTMCIPLLFWLAHWVKARWQRFAVYGSMGLTAASIFGSHSRGAFLAAIAMGLFLVMKSHRRFAALGFASVAAMLALFFMPEAYWERIQSIREYETDGSAQGRLEMWRVAIAVASDRLTGGGFDMYASGQQFLQYVETRGRSSHSIYFQALGEHGWPGLVLMLTFWIFVWRQCGAAIKALKPIPHGASFVLLMRMIQVSLVGYAVGGAFVNIGYWDFPYFLAVAVLAIRRLGSSESPVTNSRARSIRPIRPISPIAQMRSPHASGLPGSPRHGQPPHG